MSNCKHYEHKRKKIPKEILLSNERLALTKQRRAEQRFNAAECFFKRQKRLVSFQKNRHLVKLKFVLREHLEGEGCIRAQETTVADEYTRTQENTNTEEEIHEYTSCRLLFLVYSSTSLALKMLNHGIPFNRPCSPVSVFSFIY